MMQRSEVLSIAESLINGDRQNDYGSPEDNFNNIAVRWSQILKVQIQGWQVALMMADLKIARIATTGTPKPDSFIDICGYAALSQELSSDIAKPPAPIEMKEH